MFIYFEKTLIDFNGDLAFFDGSLKFSSVKIFNAPYAEIHHQTLAFAQ